MDGEARASVPSLSFDQAVARAAANQPLILKAQAEVLFARAEVGRTKSGYLPRLTAQAGYDRSNLEQGIDIGSDYVRLTPKNAYDFHIDGGMLIYDFGKRELQVKLTRSGLDSALLGVDEIKLDIACRTATIYCDLLFLKREQKELDGEIAILNEHLGSAKKKEDEGSATRIESLATQLRLFKLANRRNAAANAYAKQKIALGQLMGLPLDEDFNVDGDFPQPAETKEAQSLVAMALANRPEVQSALKAEGASELGRLIIEQSRYPSITFHGRAGYGNGILDSGNQNASSLVLNWSVGVLLTLPLFDGFQAAREAEEAAAKTEAAHQESEARRRTVTSQVLQAVQDLSASLAGVTSAALQIGQAEEYLGMSKAQYDLGVGTNGDYFDAFDTLSLARHEELNAQLQKALAGLALRQALGERIWIKE
jgi:outer membrane protein